MTLASPSPQPNAPPAAEPQPSPDAFDAAKGLLILCIVVGHLPSVVYVPGLQGASAILYRFHVVSFLMLPFLLGRARWDVRWLVDRAVRYLVPYAVWVPATAVVFGLTFARAVPPLDLAERVLFGLWTGHALHLKAATGFQLYWFLPALFALTVLRAVLVRLPAGWLPWATLAAWAVHGTVALAAPQWARAPLGLAAAAYVLPMGLMAAWLWPRVRNLPWALACIAVGLAVVSQSLGLVTNVGVLGVYGWRDAGRMLLTDLDAIASFLAIAAAGPVLARVPGLVTLDRLSFGVYLSHSLFLQAALLAAARAGWQPLGRDALPFTVLALVLTLAGSTLVARILQQTRLQPWLLPRGLTDWPPTRRLGAGVGPW